MTPIATLAPDDTAYTEAVAAYSLLHVPAPPRAVVATTVDEVAAAVGTARGLGLRVVPFSTGHAAERLGSVDDALVVRVDIDGPVVIDAAAGVARVPAGRTWAEVAVAAAEHGLLAPHGSAGTVGVIGYVLNGGVGPYARATGLAATAVVAFEYVDADGAERRADSTVDADRFWALRGGGATGIGVVTAAEVRLRPGTSITTGGRFWPAAKAAVVLRAWRDWCADAPDSITTTARVLRLPPLPGIPEPLTHGPVVVVDGIALPEEDGSSAAEALLAALDAAAGPPILDTWHAGPSTDALATHMDPPDPAPAWVAGDLLGRLDDAAIDVFVAAAAEDSPLVSHELRQLGGALASPARAGGYLDRVEEPFLLCTVAITPAPPVLAAAREHVEVLRAALGDALTGRCVPSFLSGADDTRVAVSDEAIARRAAIAAAADPDGVFALRA